MIGGVVDFHGEEGPRPDMEGYPFDADALVAQVLQQLLSEMEAGRWRRDCAVHRRIDGLVIHLVAFLRAAPGFDVGRERHRAVGLDGLVEFGAGKLEPQRNFASLPLTGERCRQGSRSTRATRKVQKRRPGCRSVVNVIVGRPSTSS